MEQPYRLPSLPAPAGQLDRQALAAKSDDNAPRRGGLASEGVTGWAANLFDSGRGGFPTKHGIDQARRVWELLDAGYSNKAIAEQLGVSGPRISQIRRQLPVLAPYLGRPRPLARLGSHRGQLWELRRQTLALAATIRRDLRDLDEELQAAYIDQHLGLRR